VLLVCVGASLWFLISSIEAIHQVTFELEVEKEFEEHLGVFTAYRWSDRL
jgi:hypothetical protein